MFVEYLRSHALPDPDGPAFEECAGCGRGQCGELDYTEIAERLVSEHQPAPEPAFIPLCESCFTYGYDPDDWDW